MEDCHGGEEDDVILGDGDDLSGEGFGTQVGIPRIGQGAHGGLGFGGIVATTVLVQETGFHGGLLRDGRRRIVLIVATARGQRRLAQPFHGLIFLGRGPVQQFIQFLSLILRRRGE